MCAAYLPSSQVVTSEWAFELQCGIRIENENKGDENVVNGNENDIECGRYDLPVLKK